MIEFIAWAVGMLLFIILAFATGLITEKISTKKWIKEHFKNYDNKRRLDTILLFRSVHKITWNEATELYDALNRNENQSLNPQFAEAYKLIKKEYMKDEKEEKPKTPK